MRHLWSFLAGVAAAPVVWVLLALGQDGSSRTVSRWVQIGTYNTANLIEAAVYLAVAGILLGLIGSLRVSPAGPLAAGLLLAAPYLGFFGDPFAVRDAVPAGWKLFGDPVSLLLPLENGTTFLIGVTLAIATFSLQRWRRWPASDSSGAASPATDDTPAGSSPSATAKTSGTRDDETPTIPLPQRTPTSREDPDDRGVPAPSLGYPKPIPQPPPPRRDGESPWSAPPRAGNRDSTFG